MGKTIGWIKVALLSCAFVAAFTAGHGWAQTQREDKTLAKFASPEAYTRLAAKAASAGSVRTLVRIEAPFTPELSLSQTEMNSQRAAMAAAQKSLISELEGMGIKTAESYRYKYVPYILLRADKTALAALAASSRVAAIEEDVLSKPMATPGWDTIQVEANVLHAAGHTGSGAYVAVLDTGVDKTHPYLAGAVASEACYSSNNETYNSTSLCPGQAPESTAVDSALPYGTGVCPAGDCDHGTHVSGTVAGRSGIVGSPGPGMAPGASLIAVQVFSRFDNAGACGGSPTCALSFSSDQIKGLERVYELRNGFNIAAVNMSLGGGEYFSAGSCNRANGAVKAVIDLLRGVGIASVISSGNSGYCGSMGSPGCISTAVSVGATDSDDLVADYSNSASFLSILAPGSAITSSVPGGTYDSWNGTSMAAPHVAGAWALIKADRADATVTDVLNGLVATGVSVRDTGKCPSVTKKRINVYDAYNRLIPPPVITVSPMTVNFGIVKEGVPSAAKTITIKNTGPIHCAPLNVDSITVSPAGEFTLTGAACPPIERLATCTFTAQVNATDYGIRTADLTIASDAPKKPAIIVRLTANAKAPVSSVTPITTNFGVIPIGSPSVKVLRVKNTGISDLDIASIVPGGDASFTVDSSDCPATLTQGQSCELAATFTPTTTDNVIGTITITSNDPDARRTVIIANLKGKGR
ncbi:MAG TPA: S8 family serine peptidase [Syntrophorhabdaceae bacterium]|jgi:subtilisin family serine protease